MEIKLAKTPAQIMFCSKALMSFRPNIKVETFLLQVQRMMDNGYQLAYIPNQDNTAAASIMGFRIFEMLRTDTIIYIDDLFTCANYRSRGHAKALLDYIGETARMQNIKMVHLDSGFDLHPAHRLYLKNGFFLACHHFVKFI